MWVDDGMMPGQALIYGFGPCSHAQIGYVKGVDLSPGEIEEARRRFEEHVRQRNTRQQGKSCLLLCSKLQLETPSYQPIRTVSW